MASVSETFALELLALAARTPKMKDVPAIDSDCVRPSMSSSVADVVLSVATVS